MKGPLYDLHASNLLTYAALASGTTAVASSLGTPNAPLAGVALAVAAIADTFDGRFARTFRRTPRQTRIGHELDSLIDTVAFGVAPVAVIGSRFATAGPVSYLSWLAAGLYLLAVVTRLAYYNVQEDDSRLVGMPAPAAALVCATSLLAGTPTWAAAWPLVLGSALMVAPVAIPRPRAIGLAMFTGWAITLVVALGSRAID